VRRWRSQYIIFLATVATIVFGLGIIVCKYYDVDMFGNPEHENAGINAIESTNPKGVNNRQSLLSKTIRERYFPTKNEIYEANQRLEALPISEQPIEVLKWVNAKTRKSWAHVTSFGISGIAITHMIHNIQNLENIPVITIDTLHLFPETYALVEKVRKVFNLKQLHVYKTKEASTREEFEDRFGPFLWRADTPLYDYLTKVLDCL
jgi:hypothetical protein